MSDQQPDTRPGFYYVTAIDGARYARLLGPFANHAGALAAVDAVRIEAEQRDPWASFWAFGTCRADDDLGLGVLGVSLTAPDEPPAKIRVKARQPRKSAYHQALRKR